MISYLLLSFFLLLPIFFSQIDFGRTYVIEIYFTTFLSWGDLDDSRQSKSASIKSHFIYLRFNKLGRPKKGRRYTDICQGASLWNKGLQSISEALHKYRKVFCNTWGRKYCTTTDRLLCRLSVCMWKHAKIRRWYEILFLTMCWCMSMRTMTLIRMMKFYCTTEKKPLPGFPSGKKIRKSSSCNHFEYSEIFWYSAWHSFWIHAFNMHWNNGHSPWTMDKV